MAVQQNKKSPSKRGMHRSHNALNVPGIAVEPTTGEIGKLIAEVLDGLQAANSDEGNAAVEQAVRNKVVALTGRFPIYPTL